MKESYSKDIASHADLKSCVVGRKAELEALTEAWAGQVLSCEIYFSPGADIVGKRGRQNWEPRNRERRSNPVQSETLSMFRNNLHENREILCSPATAGRKGKSKDAIQ